MDNIKKLLSELIQETYPSRRAMHVTPIDYRSGRGTGVPAASKFTSDTPQRTQLGRPPRPTPMHGQIGDPSVSGTDYMGSKMIQNSGDSYYIPDEYSDKPVPNLGDEDVRNRERIRKLINALFLEPENADVDAMVADNSAPSPAGHLSTNQKFMDNSLDEDEVDEISAGGVAGATVPVGVGPEYPKKPQRSKQPPSWHYYMKAVGGSVIDPEF